MEGRITAAEKSIDKRKVLIAAGLGESEQLKCLLKKEVDVNFPDKDGYTALHYAVESGKLDVVQQLLEYEEVDVFVESNDNSSPLDIARKIENQGIIDIVVERIIDNTFKVLEKSSNIDKRDRPSSDTRLEKGDEKIKRTEEKIESCLEFLKKINAVKREADQKDISYDQANILIYFLETFALEGDPGTKDQLKKYFAQYYTELDRKLFSDARNRLLKNSGKKLRLEDIGKFINGDIKSFFAKLEEYVQYVQYVKSLKNFLQVTASEWRSRETNENGIQSFLRNKFDEFTKKDQMKGKIKNAEVFNFIVQFYPGFQKTRGGIFKESRDEDVDSFFIELQEYAQYVEHVQQLEDRNSGKVNICPGYSLIQDLEKLKEKSVKLRQNIKSSEWFDFLVNFYLAFHESRNGHTRSDILRTKVKDYVKCGHHVERLKKFLKSFEDHEGDIESLLKDQIKDSFIKSGRADGVVKILQEYVQSTRQESFFLKTLKGEECNIGEEIDVGSYVKEKFEKLMVTSYTEENITQELLFDFVVNFYPAFQKETQAGLRELSDLRNKLIHDFHKYGAIEFGKEIFRLKHTLFKYYFAQQVNQALCAIEPDEDPETINKTFKNRLETFKDRYANVMKKEYPISTDEAEDFFGYKFSQVLFPGRVDHSETLVDQYLKFMVIIDCAKDSPIDDEQDQEPQSRKELNALSRREIFEEFCRLNRNREHSHGNGSYCDAETLKFEKRLLDEYGVPSHHFRKICSLYMGNESRQFDHTTKSEKIPDIIKSLKKIKDHHKLPNRVVIFLYDQCSNNKDSFGSAEHQRLLAEKGIKNPSYVIEKFKVLPPDEILDIPIGGETLSISRREVISNMLNTLYNSYHAYTIQLNIEEIFNDRVFLDYLVEKELEVIEKKVTDSIDLYLKLTLMVDMEERKMCGKNRKKIFQGFHSLRELHKHSENNRDRNYYEKEKKEFRNLVLHCGIEEKDFESLCEFIEKNYHLTAKGDGVNEVKKMINDVKSKLKQHQKLDDNARNSLIQKTMEQKLDYEQQTRDGGEKTVEVEKVLKNFAEKQVSMQLGSRVRNVDIKKVTRDMLEAFDDIAIVELRTHNYMIIKKLLKAADYTAPYIVRLITIVGSDAIIEKDDLVRLVEILLTKEDSLYIKSLNELLKLKSRKLNLYEVVCNKIVETRFNLYSMRLIFEESQHAKGILAVLTYTIQSKNQSCDKMMIKKMIELSGKVFEILIDSIYEFGLSHSKETLDVLDDGLKLVEAIKSTRIELNGEELREGNSSIDSIVAVGYNIQLRRARMKNYQGQELEKNQSPQAKKTFIEAKEKFNEAENKYNEALDILHEIPSHVHPQFLLASSRKAYTHRLLKQYDKAYEVWEMLYKKIVEFVRGSYGSNTELYTREIYTEIERSEKYKILLATSKEYNQYLNILSIRNWMATDRLYEGRYIREQVDFCKEALQIYKELYTYHKDNLGPKHINTPLNRRCIARAHVFISQLLSERKEKLKHTEDALLQTVRLNQFEIDAYGTYYPTITTNIRFIVEGLAHIASLNKKLGDAVAGIENEKSETFYKMALNLHNKIYEHRKLYSGECHEYTFESLYHVASVNERLGDVVAGSIENEKKKTFYEMALNLYNKIYEHRKRYLGEEHKYTLHTKRRVESVSKKLNKSFTAPFDWRTGRAPKSKYFQGFSVNHKGGF